MKSKILKSMKELMIILSIYFGVTIILCLIFHRAIFTSTTWVFVCTLIITKILLTIYDCRKNSK